MIQKLFLKQSLQWKMNQSLMQSINILQLTSSELMDRLQDIANENPLIEEVDMSMDWGQFKPIAAESQSIGEMNPSDKSMYDQLKESLYMIDITDSLRPVVEYGIDSLNEDGYLDITLDEWAFACKVDQAAIETALSSIQSLEPAGIGARSLKECILLQMEQFGNDMIILEDLLENRLEYIAANDSGGIARLYGISMEEAKQMIDQVRLCHPKPGRLLEPAKTDYIIPEAIIFKEEGQWKISFYKWSSPKITINKTYEKFEKGDTEIRDYLKDKMREIESLKQAISYRHDTLERVIHSMVKRQLDFLEEGIIELQPLTLKEIADELQLHISTISRAVSHKYVQTPRGVLPLKFFLQNGIEKSGKKVASFVVKQLIAEMIDGEDKKKPLSDEAIKLKLKALYQIDVARRTVMKYREQMELPSSVKRKQRS